MSDSYAGQDADRVAVVRINPDPGFVLIFDGLQAAEELGRPFLFELNVSSGKRKGELVSLLGSSVTLILTRPDRSKRYFNGVLTRVVYAGLSGGSYHYRLELRPWIWLLSRTQDCRIFQEKSAFSIITEAFRDAGFTDFEDRRQNQAGDAVLDYCVQYRESTLDFVTRLMEQFGLCYSFVHADDRHTVVLGDDPASFVALAAPVPYQTDQTDFRATEDHVWNLSSDLRLQPGSHTYRDYNFATPSADLTTRSIHAGSHPHGRLEVYDYPGPYQTTDGGQTLADIRMQAVAAQRQLVDGITNAREVMSGVRFRLSGFPEAPMNQEYLVISGQYTLSVAESLVRTEGDQLDTWRSTFRAVPSSSPFQLESRTPRPRISGVQTARVVGQPGQEITTDRYGRIKVKFFWDRTAAQDDSCSCWIRVAQPWAGSGWGAMFIPRVGQEVVVEFLEGNPDRPLVTGSVYNATHMVPYALPDHKTRSTIKSSSSIGDGGFNEFRFEDKKGAEEVLLQAQKDFTTIVLNNENATITQNSTTTILKGDHSLAVTIGSSTIQAGASITLKVGVSSIRIDETGITLNGPTIRLTSDAVAITAAATTVEGAAINLTAAATTVEGAAINLTAAATLTIESAEGLVITAPDLAIG